MKKILLGLIIIMLTACANTKTIFKKIEINDANCKKVREADMHGGFLGDGESFVQFTCSNLDKNNLSSNWKELPLSSEISEIMEMVKCDDIECSNTFAKYNILNINEGYYYFYDRHNEAVNKYDATDLNKRSSYNFTLAIWNKSNKTLYYYELDT